MSPLARRGAAWAMTGYATSQLLRLGGNLILWRLLHPESFGLMAIVNVFMQGLHMFSDVGIGPSIIQNPRGDDPDYLNTAWTIQVIRGALLFVVATLAAAPVAAFYAEPELARLIPVVAFASLLSGFNSTRWMTATRHMRLSRITMIEFVVQLCGLFTMVGVALVHRTVWALVVGGTVAASIKLVLSHLLLKGVTNHFRWDHKSAVTLLKFGRWIFLSTLLAFTVDQSDRLIFGKLVPMSALGVYSIALMWAMLPNQVIHQIFNSVLFPLLSRIHNRGEDIASSFRKAAMPWLIFAGWLVTCLFAGGPLLIEFLYDERAVQASRWVQILSVGAWFGILGSASSTTLFAQGVPKWVVFGSGGKLLGMVGLIPLGFWAAGFQGAVVGYAASEVLCYAVVASAAARLKLKDFGIDARLTFQVAAFSAAGLLCASLLAEFIHGVGSFVTFLRGICVFLVVSSAWGASYWMQRSRTRAERVLLRVG